MPFSTLVIGRASSADLKLHAPSVSRRHAEVTLTESRRCYLVDCASSRGTFRREATGGWVRHRQGYVDADVPLRLGKLETTLSTLLESAAGPVLRPAQPSYEQVSIRPRRNLASGEVEVAPRA